MGTMEQRNSIQFLILTSLISILLIAIAFGVSSGVKAITGNADTSYFEKNTFIGPVKVDGLTKEQASLVLTQETESWKNNQQPTVQFLLEKVKLDFKVFEFDIQSSVSQAISGQVNPLLVSINKENVDRTMNDMGLIEGLGIEFEKFEAALLEHANNLTEVPKTIYLTNYLIEVTDKDLVYSTVTMESVSADGSFENWIRKHNEIVMEEGAVFSLNELLKNESDGLYSDEFHNNLSSALYKAALNSPFSIVERHMTTDNRFKQEVGYEAYVDVQHDLKFKNQFGSKMKIISNLDGDSLNISVVGPTSPIQIKSSKRDESTLKPRIIVYPVESLSDEYEVEGEDGIQVTVVRNVTIGDSAWKTYTHSVDSYLPTPEKWYRVFEEDQEEGE